MIKTAVTQTSLGPMGGQENIDPVGGDNITMVVVVNRRTNKRCNITVSKTRSRESLMLGRLLASGNARTLQAGLLVLTNNHEIPWQRRKNEVRS